MARRLPFKPSRSSLNQAAADACEGVVTPQKLPSVGGGCAGPLTVIVLDGYGIAPESASRGQRSCSRSYPSLFFAKCIPSWPSSPEIRTARAKFTDFVTLSHPFSSVGRFPLNEIESALIPLVMLSC